jgi:uncharacterized protein (TIGR00661 family)
VLSFSVLEGHPVPVPKHNVFFTVNSQKRILITPLDWGLGHATRCIPIVRYLLEKNIEVVLATNGRPMELLKKEFPELTILPISSYDIKYFSNSIFINLLFQSYKVFRAVLVEQQQVKKIVKDYQIDAIISDNRFGCNVKRLPTAFISHQLHLIAGNSFLENWVNKINHYYIKEFDECWIPDFKGSPNLAGRLSHPPFIPETQYLGALTRIKPLKKDKKYDIAFILSGPEPQRTRLEKKILQQVNDLPYQMVLVQGKPEKEEFKKVSDNLEIFSYRTGAQLNEIMAGSDLIVCRSGYSTILDLVALGKKTLLIPTPGQTEQEYLAELYEKQGISYRQTQQRLNLKEGIEKAMEFKGFGEYPYSEKQWKEVVDRFVERIHK